MKKVEEIKKRVLNKKNDDDNKTVEKLKKIFNKYLISGFIVGLIVGSIFVNAGRAQNKESYNKQISLSTISSVVPMPCSY